MIVNGAKNKQKGEKSTVNDHLKLFKNKYDSTKVDNKGISINITVM